MAKTFSDSPLKPGDLLPDFTLKSHTGETVRLHGLNKKGFLVVFICNHCPYVVPKIPALIDLQKKFPEIQILAINSNDPTDYPDDSWENSVKTARDKGFNFLYLHDPDQTVAKAFGAVCTPDPFLADAEFKLFYHGRLDPEHRALSDGRDMEEAVKRLISGDISPAWESSLGCSIKWKPEYYQERYSL